MNRARAAVYLEDDLAREGISAEAARSLPQERWEAIAVSVPGPLDEQLKALAISGLERRERLAQEDIFKRFEG